MKAARRPSSDQPRDSSGHKVKKCQISSRSRGQMPETEVKAMVGGTGGGLVVTVPCAHSPLYAEHLSPPLTPPWKMEDTGLLFPPIF